MSTAFDSARWREQAIRLYFQNINGVRLGNNGVDVGDLFLQMNEIRADIFGFAETKINSQHQLTKELFYRHKRSIWDHCKIQFGHSAIPFDGPDKPGGLLLGVTGCLVGRVRNQYADSYGRWCGTSLMGRDNRELHIIVAYQVVQKSGSHGDQTFYEQQRSLLRQAGFRDPNPRALFVRDLSAHVKHLRDRQCDVILMGDFNEETGEEVHGLQTILDAGQLTDAHVYRHGLDCETPTYARGTRRVDYVFVSTRMLAHIKACGAEPFNHRIFSDHRGLFVDLFLPGIFDRAPVPIANPPTRFVRTDVPPLLVKYVLALDEYCQLHRVYEHAKTLVHDEHPDSSLAEKVERDLLRGMLQAELKCKYYRRLPWTIDVHSTMTHLYILKSRLSEMLTGWDMSNQIKKKQATLPVPVEVPTTYVDTMKAIRKVRRQCRLAARAARAKQTEYHQLRIEALQKAHPDRDPARVEAQYLKAQELKTMYQRVPSLNPRASSGITVLKVPVDPTADPKTVPRDDPSQWKIIQDPAAIEATLLQRNLEHFGQARDTPLAQPHVIDALGWGAQTPTANAILEGTFDVSTLTTDKQAQNILRACKRRAPERRHLLELAELMKKFKLWDERTTTSPSGRHLSHYHALFRPSGLDPTTDSEQFQSFLDARRAIWEAHFSTLKYAEKTGYCFDLWKTVVTAMLEKEPGNPYLHRLRVIHLYEATLNAFFGIKFRDLLHYAEGKHLLNPGCYGSRPGRQALDPILVEILQYDYVMATRFPHLKFNNDATSCYDRMLSHITVLIARSFGLQTTVAQVQGNFLEYAQYFIKTMLGVSKTSYQHSGEHPVFGNGQGSTSSPPAWALSGSVYFDIFDQQCHGAKYQNPDGSHSLKLGMVGFVDDNNSQTAGDRYSTMEEMVASAQHDAQLWRDILYASGGDLELSKCYYHFLWVQFTTKGAPVLKPGQFGPRLTLHDAQGHATIIEQLSSTQAHKILGSHQAPAENQRAQFRTLLAKSKKCARLLASSYVRPGEAWTFYLNFFLPSIGYSLGASHLTMSQLDVLQRTMVSVTLQKMNYTSKFPRAVVFGPSRFCGLDLRDLKVEQGVDQILLLLRNLRTRDSQAGSLAIITIDSLQFTAGTSRPLLEYPETPLPQLDGFWIKSLRQFLASLDAQIIIAGTTIQPLQREHDAYLMDVVLTSGDFNGDDVRIVNACRLYLEVLTVSDIATADGRSIQPSVLSGELSMEHCTSRLMQPRQDRPSDSHWVKWRRLLRILATSNGKLHQPLGPWLFPNSLLRRTWKFLFSPESEALYIWQGQHYTVHRPVRPHVFASIPIRTELTCPDGVPVSCDTIIDGFRIPPSFHGVVPPPPSTRFHATLQEFIDSQPDHVASLLQLWEIPVGDVYSAFATVTDLSDIAMVTDGGAASEYGSFGWVIGRISTEERLARGKGLTFGYDPKSYRAENYGGKAAHWFLQLCFSFLGKPLPSGSLQFYSDNQGFVKKQLFVRSYPNALASTSLHSEWDLIVANFELMQAYPDPPSIHHVHGHQDKVSSVSDLPFAVQLNIEADALSSEALASLGTPFPRVPFDPASRAQLNIGGYTVTRRIATTIRTRAALPALRKYYNERFQWTEECFDTIDWDAFSQGARRQKLKRKFITKLSFNQLPTGRRLHRRDSKYDDRCPSCHLPHETDDHIFQCPDRLRALWRKDFLLFLDHKFRSMLDPFLFQILQRGLRAYFQADMDSLSWDDIPLAYHSLIRAQTYIGWDHLVRGKFVRDWQELQSKYTQRLPASSSCRASTNFFGPVISVILEKAHELWKLRCDARHGHDRATAARAEVEQVERSLRQLYALRDRVQLEDRACFYTDVETHMEMPIRSIKNWLNINAPLIRYSVRAAETDVRRTTPAITTHFSPVPVPSPLRRSRHARRSALATRTAIPLSKTRPTRLSNYFPLTPSHPPHPLRYTRPRTTTPNSYSRSVQRKLSDLWPDHPS